MIEDLADIEIYLNMFGFPRPKENVVEEKIWDDPWMPSFEGEDPPF